MGVIQELWQVVSNLRGKESKKFVNPDWMPADVGANMTGDHTFSSAKQTVFVDTSRAGGPVVVERADVTSGFVYPPDTDKQTGQRGMIATAQGHRETQDGEVKFEMSAAEVKGNGMSWNGKAQATSGSQPPPKEQRGRKS